MGLRIRPAPGPQTTPGAPRPHHRHRRPHRPHGLPRRAHARLPRLRHPQLRPPARRLRRTARRHAPGPRRGGPAPRETTGTGVVRAAVPEPARADCRYYRPDADLLGTGRVYRLCFTGGRLTAKNSYDTHQLSVQNRDDREDQ
ncbi:hypothetical protein [Actinomadura madurae]|uniref:hypothetical protein n=1 Tax=Actinomadura madurae TaxID=1993 RepID=UPI0020D221D7|nr:hypothetical protein [Actinomadura madurae]MCQ0011552.1 hypothetical protein [Actinomadura madurae]